MSVTDPRTSPAVDVRDRDRTVVTHSDRAEHDHRETRPFPKTSEFWAFVVGIVAITAIYNALDAREQPRSERAQRHSRARDDQLDVLALHRAIVE